MEWSENHRDNVFLGKPFHQREQINFTIWYAKMTMDTKPFVTKEKYNVLPSFL